MMLLNYLSAMALLIGALSGMLVLYLGDWRKFGLKYAGVALSTTSVILLSVLAIEFNLHCSGTFSACSGWYIYMLMHGGALILLHMAVGRDAIRLKQFDRRKSDIL